jgi:hypothetical protein
MNKVTLTFPDYESLWLFKEKVKTVNISIEPKKKNIHGPFNGKEVEMALVEFKAINNSAVPGIANSTQVNLSTEVLPRFHFLSGVFNFLQFLKV